jgi:hypothetical protein
MHKILELFRRFFTFSFSFAFADDAALVAFDFAAVLSRHAVPLTRLSSFNDDAVGS